MNINRVVFVSTLMVLSSTCQVLPRHMKVPRLDDSQKLFNNKYKVEMPDITGNQENVFSHKEVSKESSEIDLPLYELTLDKIMNSKRKEQPLKQYKIQNPKSNFQIDGNRIEMAGWNDGYHIKNSEFLHRPKSRDEKVRLSNRKTKQIFLRRKREALEENTDIKPNFSSEPTSNFTLAPEEHSSQYIEESFQDPPLNDIGDSKQREFSIDSDSEEIVINDSVVDKEISDEYMNETVHPEPRHSRTQKRIDQTGLHATTSAGLKCNGCQCGCKDGKCLCDRHNESSEERNFSLSFYEDTSRESRSSNEEKYSLINNGVEESFLKDAVKNVKKPYISTGNVINSVLSPQTEEISNEIFSSESQKHYKNDDYDLYSEEFKDEKNSDDYEAFSGLGMLDQTQKDEFGGNYGKFRHRRIGDYISPEFWGEVPHSQNFIYERNLRVPTPQSGVTVHGRIRSNDGEDAAININNPRNGEYAQYTNFRTYNPENLISKEITPLFAPESRHVGSEKLISSGKSYSPQNVKIPFYKDDKSDSTDGASYLTSSDLSEERKSYPISQSQSVLKFSKYSLPNSSPQNSKNKIQEKLVPSQNTVTHENHYVVTSIDEKVLNNTNVKPQYTVQGQNLLPDLESVHNPMYSKDEINLFDQSTDKSFKRPRNTFSEIYYTGDSDSNYDKYLRIPFVPKSEKHVPKQSSYYENPSDYTQSHRQQRLESDLKSVLDNNEFNLPKSYVPYSPAAKEIYLEIPRPNDKIWKFRKYADQSTERRKFTESERITEDILTTKTSKPTEAKYDYTTELQYSQKPKLPSNYFLTKLGDLLSVENPKHNSHYNHKDKSYYWQEKYDAGSNLQDYDKANKHELQHIYDLNKFGTDKGNAYKHSKEVNTNNANWKMDESLEDKMAVILEKEQEDNCEEIVKLLLSQSTDTDIEPLLRQIDHPRGTNEIAKIFTEVGICDLYNYKTGKTENSDEIINIQDKSERDKATLYKINNANNIITLDNLKENDSTLKIDKFSPYNIDQLELKNILKLLLNNIKLSNIQENKKHQYIHNHNLDISDEIMTSLSPRDEPDSTGNSKYASHKNEYEDRTAEIIKIYPSEKEYDIILENKVKSDHQTVNDENLNKFQNKLTQNTFQPRKFHHLDSTEEIINFPLVKNKYSNIEDSTKYKSSKIINPENSREYVNFSSHNKPLDSIIENIKDASFINDHLYSDEITTIYTSNDKDDKISGNKPGISTEIYSCNERGHKIYDNQFSPYHPENKDKIAEFESKKNEFNDIAENAKHVGQHLKISQSINSDEVKLTSEEIDYNLTPYKVHFSENNAETLKHLSSNKKFDKYDNYRGSHEDTADHLTYKDKTYYDRAFIKHELQKLLSSQDDETETFYKPYINSHNVADLNEFSYNNEHNKDDEQLKHSTRIFLKQKQIHKLLGTGSNEEISSDKRITVKNHDADLTPADVEVIRYDVIENPKFLVGKEENLKTSLVKYKTNSVKDDNFASINKYNCDILHGNSKSYENQISKPVLTSSEENNDRIKEESLLKKLSLPSELKKQELKVFNELLNSNLYKDVTQTELGEVMKSLISNDHDELYKDAVQLETEHAISKIIDQNRVIIKDTENIIKKQNHDLMTGESYRKLQDAINACRKLKKLIGKDKNNDDFKLSVLKLLKEVGPLQNIQEDNSDILKIIKYYTVLNSDADDGGESAEETEEKTGSSEGHYSSDFQNKKYSMPYVKKKTQDQTLGKNVFKLEEITENLISAQNKENGEEKEVPKINTKNVYSTVIHKTLPVERIIINDGSRYNYDKSGDVQNLQVIIRENTLKKIRDEDDKFSSLQKNSQEDKCKTYNELLPLYYKLCELQQKEYEKSKDHLYKNIDIPKHEDYINTSEYLKTKILHSSFRDENSVHNREPINTFESRRNDNHNPEVDVYLKNVHSEDYKKWTSPNDDDDDNVDFKKQNHKHPYEDLLKLISDDKLHLNHYFKSDEDKCVNLAKNELLKIQESFIKPRCSEIIQIFRLRGICSEENDVREVDNLDNYIEYESNMKLPNKLKSEIVIHNRDTVYPNGDEITDLSTDIYDNIPTFNERYDNQINKHNTHFDNSDLYEKIKILTRYLDSLDSRYEDSMDKTAFKKVSEGSIKSFPETKHYLIQKDIIHEHNNLDAREKNEHIITEVKDKIVNNLYPNKDSYIVDTITDEDIENVTDELMVTKGVNIIPNKIDDIIEKWCRSKIESRKQSDILNKAENDLIREKLRVRLVKMILKKLKDQINDNRYESKSSVTSEMSPYCRHICYGDSTVREYKVPLIAIRKDMCHKCKGNKLTRVFNKPPISTTSDKEITDKYTKSIQRVDIYPSPIKEIDVYPNNKEIVEIIHPNYLKSFNDYGLQRQNVKEIIDIKPKYIQGITGIKPKSIKEIGLYPNYVTDIIPNQFRENFHIQPNHIKEIIYTYPNHSKEINGIQARDNNEISAIFPKYNETEVYPKRVVENVDIIYPSNFKQFLDTQWKYVRARPEHIKDISDVHSERNNDKLYQILPPKPLIDNTAGKYENYISKPDYVDYLGHIFRERSPRSHSDTVSENSEDLTQINPSTNENQDTFNPEQSFDIEPNNRRKRNPQKQRIKKMSHNSSETQIKPPAQKS